ncbi:SDR family oxidoreductase [Kribbella sandramycini]|uniref:NAD(P)-dependent dehydrogenase (Short-subunit alcohol dehydrogenase family) n=1 Tax=Kribbella sandramycini TaxID=60450 RepID=A0A7Y4KVW4_9ACTN|nr:SDR family oxidoreductase [Kribbella sandramycini]MBB6567711.1 NAD(P)-dependent dehydrogenase (short-subunit alcohol dehydrogenase family) [Kribbella sandramycini]NOL39689.1 SDR family oxidoreductase [Kribbella sandramycini]
MTQDSVVVVIGVGGMGISIARRQGVGRTLLLADFNDQTLKAAAEVLRAEGYDVSTRTVDVSSRASVVELAEQAVALGPVLQVVHTAGLSPEQAAPAAILAVDLLGVALVLEEFGRIIEPGGAGVVIASLAGYMAAPLDAEQEQALVRAKTDDLLSLPFVASVADGASGYGLAKRANQLRVQAASVVWGERGARVNSISPGIISTAMSQQELSGPAGGFMRTMIDGSAAKRLGTPADITEAAAFLLGSSATYLSGVDLLVDGGVLAAVRSGAIELPY